MLIDDIDVERVYPMDYRINRFKGSRSSHKTLPSSKEGNYWDGTELSHAKSQFNSRGKEHSSRPAHL